MSDPHQAPGPTLARLRGVVFGGAAVWAVVLLVVFALRATFPLELEWMEGGSLQQALRIQRGEPVYGPPSAEYVPFLYTPGYSVLLAGLGYVFPLDFMLARLVSVGAVIATCVGLWRLVDREGKPTAHAAAAVGLFLAAYVFAFRWLDLARVDATFMALVLWALVLLREAWGDWRKALGAGLLMGLAFWTKQTAFVFVLASGLACLIVAPKQLWIYALTVAVIDLGGVALGNAVTDGWLWHYVYELHQDHRFNWERFQKKTWGMFLHGQPFLLGAVLTSMLAASWPALARTRRLDRKEEAALWARLQSRRGELYWGVLALAGLLVSAMGYSTQWAEPNAFVPGVTLLAAFVGVALPVGGRWEVAGLGLVVAQLGFALAVEPTYQPIQDQGLRALSRSYRWQDPWRTVPTRVQRHQARELRAQLVAADGEVLALYRPWWPVLAAGKTHAGHVAQMGITDVGKEEQKTLVRQLRKDLQATRYVQVWLDKDPPRWMRSAMARGYRLEARRRGMSRVRPLSGYMSDAGMVTRYRGDQLLFVPVSAPQAPSGARLVADFEDGRLGAMKVAGNAFGRRAVHSIHGQSPPVGPIGGAYLLSSAATSRGVKGEGTATSTEFLLDGELWMLLGKAGPLDGISASIEWVDGPEFEPISIPDTQWSLMRLKVPVPKGWEGRRVRLVVDDQSQKSAVFLDEVWVVPPS